MRKDIIAVIAVLLGLCLLANGVEIQSVEEYELIHTQDITPDSDTAFISISCKTILDNYGRLDDNLKDEKYVPSNGVILEKSEYALLPGDSAFSLLQRAVRACGIQMEYQGASENRFGSVYVQGINYIYEFSCGAHSGWLYCVNGSFPKLGCSEYTLSDGDVVEWIYTCNLGADCGAEIN